MRSSSCQSLLSRSLRINRTVCKSQVRTIFIPGKEFAEGEIALLRDTQKGDRYWLSHPLRSGQRINTHIGDIKHDNIIGKSVRSKVETTSGRFVRALRPTLEEYTRLSTRLVTPIYAQVANIIVSLLDIHIARPKDGVLEPSSRTEILESGTGHGSLTIQLARAIHSANPPPVLLGPSREPDTTEIIPSGTPTDDQNLQIWKQKLEVRARRRNAVIHSVEISDKYSRLAKRFVRNFRNGMYYGDIDFNVGCVSDWIKSRFAEKGSEEEGEDAFLDHILLDMPTAADHLALCAKALKVNGCLVVFFPSITQVTRCFTAVKRNDLPLWLDRVIELDNTTAGGRYWDVRLAQIRANAAVNEVAREDQSVGNDDRESGLICRPEFGFERLGTSFVGLFQRKSA